MTALTGIGLYSPKQAERLTGIESRKIRRWLMSDDSGIGPLWHPEPERLGAHDAISFRDLLELQAVWALRKHRVSMQAIREALINLHARYGGDYPLTSPELSTDGRTVFFTTLKESGDECMADVTICQQVFAEVMRPSILESIHFDENATPQWWEPDPTDPSIRIDPKIGFGKPHVLPSRMPTRTLSKALDAEGGDAAAVARQYGVTEDEVTRAANFERRMAAGENLH